MSLTMSLLTTKDIGGSMLELSITEEPDEDSPRLKESKGLLRRAFSSKRRKKKKEFVTNVSPRGSSLRMSPLSPCSCTCALLSAPFPGGYSAGSSPGSPNAGCIASDLAARRGVFSRKHYGSVELLNSTDSEGSAQSGGRFRVETGEREGEELISSPVHSPVHLENPEFHTRWYFKYFLGKLHQNYVGYTEVESDRDPFILSVVLSDANNLNVQQYRAILWRKTGNQKICLPYNPNKPMTVKGILSHFEMGKMDRIPKEIYSPEIQRELLVLEEQEGSVNFKFGVVYAKEGQVSDDDMYANEDTGEEYQNFLHLLGDPVKLKGWDRFRAGLDTKNDTTGTDSIYTVYEGHEIMFHISTYLPYSKDNKQQVERKRHIGNDIVNIVFVECEDHQTPSFRPAMMKTRFTHIYAVVTYSRSDYSYRLIVYSEESVPLFGPPLPSKPVFKDHQQFRDFLLVKLINGEKAAFNTPVFAQKRQRTLEVLIQNIASDYMVEGSKNMLSRRAFSDIRPENVHGSRRKEEARRLEFLRIGQSLKLKTILKGDAPTSMASSGALLKHQPWEPQCFLHNFPYDVWCGDSWGDKLIVATSAGTMVLEEGAIPRIIFDKSVVIKQLNVMEAHGLLIFRTDKGKEGKIHVFQLTDFEGEQNEDVVRNRTECKHHKLEATKGCHLYAVSRAGSSHLRLVVGVHKKLLFLMWKHSTAWSAWCHNMPETDVVEGFQVLREFSLSDVPQLLTLVECPRQDNQICVGYKNHFDLINEKNGDTLQLYHVEANKTTLVSALDIYEDDEPELLLCYNHVCHFQKLKEDHSHQFDFQWNSEPKGIVCAFPYILAFTPDTIEIRLIVNGSLVNTMTMTQLQLITSKGDIYFLSSASESCMFNSMCKAWPIARNPFPTGPDAQNVSIYKIPLMCLSGQMAVSVDKGTPQSPSLLQPLVSNPNNAQHASWTPPLLNTKHAPHLKDIQSYDGTTSYDSTCSISTVDSATESPKQTGI